MMYREKWTPYKYPLEYAKHMRERNSEKKIILSQGGKSKMFNLTFMNKLTRIEWVSEWVIECHSSASKSPRHDYVTMKKAMYFAYAGDGLDCFKTAFRLVCKDQSVLLLTLFRNCTRQIFSVLMKNCQWESNETRSAKTLPHLPTGSMPAESCQNTTNNNHQKNE